MVDRRQRDALSRRQQNRSGRVGSGTGGVGDVPNVPDGVVQSNFNRADGVGYSVVSDGLFAATGGTVFRRSRRRRFSVGGGSIFITFILDQDTISAPVRDYYIGGLVKSPNFAASFNTRKFSLLGKGKRDWVFGAFDQVTGNIEFFDGRDDSSTSVIAPIGIFTDFYFGYNRSASSATPVQIIDVADGNAIETGDPSGSSPAFTGTPCTVPFGTATVFTYPVGGGFNKNPTQTTINGPGRRPDRLERIFTAFGVDDTVDPADFGITAPITNVNFRTFIETTTALGGVGVATFCPVPPYACSVQGETIDQPVTFPAYQRVTTDNIEWNFTGETPVHGIDGGSLTPNHGTVEASRVYNFSSTRDVSEGEVNAGLECVLTTDVLNPLQWRMRPSTVQSYTKGEASSYTDTVTRRTVYEYPILPTASIQSENSEISTETFSSSVVNESSSVLGIYNLTRNKTTTTIREQIFPLFTEQNNQYCIYYRDRETIVVTEADTIVNGQRGYEISSYSTGNSYNTYSGFMGDFGVREDIWVKNFSVITDRTIERQIFMINAGGGETELDTNNFDGLDRISGTGTPSPEINLPDLEVGETIQMAVDGRNHPWKYWTRETVTFARDPDNVPVGSDSTVIEKTELPYWSGMLGRQVILQQSLQTDSKRWIAYATITAIQYNDGNDPPNLAIDIDRDIASMTVTITEVIGAQKRPDVIAVFPTLHFYLIDGVANNELPEEQDYVMVSGTGGVLATIYEESRTQQKSRDDKTWASGEITDINPDGSVRQKDKRVEGGIFPINNIDDNLAPIVTFYHP